MAKPPPTTVFFKKRKPSNKVSLLEDKTRDAPAAKKKYSHHTPTNGFSPNNINKRVNNYIARQPQGNWRQLQKGCEIPYMFVIQTWTYGDKTCQVYHFSPWGMHGTIEIRLSRPPVKANFHCLPLEIRERLDLKVETFDKTSLTVATSNTGRQNPLPFIRFYCVDCQTKLLPKLLNNPKYGNLKTVEELVTNWDAVGVPEGLTDLIGCFVCDLDERVHMGPNKNNFFKDPTNHRKSLHPELWFDKVDRMGKKHVERVTEIQKLLCSDKSTAPILTLVKPAVPCKEKSSSLNSSSTTSAQQAVITGKYNSKTKF